jgi:PHP family Zn ribbon phosphoesterase
MEAHHDSWEIDPEDQENAKLREWVEIQQQEYRKWNEGQDAIMMEEKVKELEAIGFQFTHVKWDERIKQLKEYKMQNGDLVGVLDKDPELGKWTRSIRPQCKTFFGNEQADSRSQRKILGAAPSH